MIRTALAVIAATLLCGCASLGHGLTPQPLQSASTGLAVGAPCDCEQTSLVIHASASPVPLERRQFTSPSGRAPDQRAIFITASDYAWRGKRGHARRRRRRAR